MNIIEFVIEDGPSKFDLMLSLFDGDTGRRREVAFYISGYGHTKCRTFIVVNGLAWQDGSGESWNLEGYCIDHKEKVRGQYSTRTRKGWIELSVN